MFLIENTKIRKILRSTQLKALFSDHIRAGRHLDVIREGEMKPRRQRGLVSADWAEQAGTVSQPDGSATRRQQPKRDHEERERGVDGLAHQMISTIVSLSSKCPLCFR